MGQTSTFSEKTIELEMEHNDAFLITRKMDDSWLWLFLVNISNLVDIIYFNANLLINIKWITD